MKKQLEKKNKEAGFSRKKQMYFCNADIPLYNAQESS